MPALSSCGKLAFGEDLRSRAIMSKLPSPYVRLIRTRAHCVRRVLICGGSQKYKASLLRCFLRETRLRRGLTLAGDRERAPIALARLIRTRARFARRVRFSGGSPKQKALLSQ